MLLSAFERGRVCTGVCSSAFERFRVCTSVLSVFECVQVFSTLERWVRVGSRALECVQVFWSASEQVVSCCYKCFRVGTSVFDRGQV